MKIKKYISIIFEIILGLPKSIYINLKYLPLSQAIKMPIIVSKYCDLIECSGKLKIENNNIRTGMILIGIGNVGIFNKKSNRSSVELSKESETIFKGKARLGNGVAISSSGNIVFGENFTITAASMIYCTKSIIFGDGVLISWENLIMDTDVHKIYKNERLKSVNLPIKIGDNVWIGARCTILKGSTIGSNNVIGSNTLINKCILDENVIIAGNPVGIIQHDIEWKR